jgi:hypothetical protein
MRRLSLTSIGVFCALLSSGAESGGDEGRRPAQVRSTARSNALPAELARSRAEVIQRIRETREGAEKLLALHENEQQRLAEAYRQRRQLYQEGLIARNDVLQAEYALARAMLKVDEDKRWIAETDSALTEVAMRDELLRSPKLGIGGFTETRALLRFNGASPWRLTDVSGIERFFFEAFGRNLPISAVGQTATHDRLRFDHRDAVDVALHPDSKEGQSLLHYLRRAGIPFIAFRGVVPGSSTGAHIHIGKPSARL